MYFVIEFWVGVLVLNFFSLWLKGSYITHTAFTQPVDSGASERCSGALTLQSVQLLHLICTLCLKISASKAPNFMLIAPPTPSHSSFHRSLTGQAEFPLELGCIAFWDFALMSPHDSYNGFLINTKLLLFCLLRVNSKIRLFKVHDVWDHFSPHRCNGA